MSAALEARGITVSFGGVQALRGVDLDVQPGQLVGLIGPNGAGKTTFVDAITGFVRATGTVRVGDVDVAAMAPAHRARTGLTRTWQAGELFDDLTVLDNLAVATSRRGRVRDLLAGRRTTSPAVERAVETLGITDLVDRMPGELTTGQRRLVGVARAMASEPTVLCLDEPAAGLDVHESQELGSSLRALVAGGTALLLVDHDMGLVLSVCDQVVVLEFGQVIAIGRPESVSRDPVVVQAYLGDTTSPGITPESSTADTPASTGEEVRK